MRESHIPERQGRELVQRDRQRGGMTERERDGRDREGEGGRERERGRLGVAAP